jgi:hypothetical protein
MDKINLIGFVRTYAITSLAVKYQLPPYKYHLIFNNKVSSEE